MRRKLPFREWFVIQATLGFLLSIGIITWFNSRKAREILLKKYPSVSVTVQGAVNWPGVYSFDSGITIREVLRRAKPLRSANCKAFSQNNKIFESCTLDVPELEYLTIFVTGAVRGDVTVQMPINSRVCSLRKKIEPLEDADLSVLNSRRYLKDSETIEIPLLQKDSSHDSCEKRCLSAILSTVFIFSLSENKTFVSLSA